MALYTVTVVGHRGESEMRIFSVSHRSPVLSTVHFYRRSARIDEVVVSDGVEVFDRGSPISFLSMSRFTCARKAARQRNSGAQVHERYLSRVFSSVAIRGF